MNKDITVKFDIPRKDQLKPGNIQVYLVNPKIDEATLKDLARKHVSIDEQLVRSLSQKHNVPEDRIRTDIQEQKANLETSISEQVKEAPGLFKTQHGLNIRHNLGDVYSSPGASFIPIGEKFNRLKNVSKETMGLGVANMVLHEIGHGFQLDHPKNAQDQIMDARTIYSSTPTIDELRNIHFTGPNKLTFTNNLEKWLRTGR